MPLPFVERELAFTLVKLLLVYALDPGGQSVRPSQVSWNLLVFVIS